MDTQNTQTSSERRERYIMTAKDALANGDAKLAQRLLQLAVDGGTGEDVSADKVAGKRGKPNRSGGKHPLAEKARAWVQTQRFVTTPSLIAHFSSLKGEGGQYQANKLLRWLESEGVVSAGNKRAGRAVLANVTADEVAEGRPSVPKIAKAKKAKNKKERIRRTNDEIQVVGDKFFQIVKDHPGQRMAQLRTLLGMTAHELMKPVAVLIEQDLVRTEGDKRGTTYFATVEEDGPKAGRAKKASSAKRATTKKTRTAKKSAPETTDEALDAAAAEAVGAREVPASAPETVPVPENVSEPAVVSEATAG